MWARGHVAVWDGAMRGYLGVVDLFFLSSPEDIFFIALRERGRGVGMGRERQREISIGHLVICDQESNPQPGYVPRLGIEPTTFQSTRGCSNQLNHTGQGSAVDLLTQTNSQ